MAADEIHSVLRVTHRLVAVESKPAQALRQARHPLRGHYCPISAGALAGVLQPGLLGGNIEHQAGNVLGHGLGNFPVTSDAAIAITIDQCQLGQGLVASIDQLVAQLPATASLFAREQFDQGVVGVVHFEHVRMAAHLGKHRDQLVAVTELPHRPIID